MGSFVIHYQLEISSLVRSQRPEMAQTWQDVANIRIRCKGTIGGNIMAADPDYDFALAAMAAGAQLHFLGKDGVDRTVSAMGLSRTSQHGLLTAITIPSFPRSASPLIARCVPR